MAEESGSHTMQLLRELRDEMRHRFDKLGAKVDSLNERTAVLEMKTDGRSGQLSAIIGLLGNRTDRLELLERKPQDR